MHLCFNVPLQTTTAYTRLVLSSRPWKFQNCRFKLWQFSQLSEVNSSTSQLDYQLTNTLLKCCM